MPRKQRRAKVLILPVNLCWRPVCSVEKDCGCGFLPRVSGRECCDLMAVSAMSLRRGVAKAQTWFASDPLARSLGFFQ